MDTMLRQTYSCSSDTSTSPLPLVSDCFDFRLDAGFSARKIRSTSSGRPGHSRRVFTQFWQAGRVSSHCVPLLAMRRWTKSQVLLDVAYTAARTLMRRDLQVRQPREGRPRYTYNPCISAVSHWSLTTTCLRTIETKNPLVSPPWMSCRTPSRPWRILRGRD